MSKCCPHCHARFWMEETINCCFSGSLIIPEPTIPQSLSDLIYSAPVRKNIRSYNMAMAMAYVGHKNMSLPDGTFVMGGRSYHRIGSLLPSSGQDNNFAQIYLLDTLDATSRRSSIFGNRLDIGWPWLSTFGGWFVSACIAAILNHKRNVLKCQQRQCIISNRYSKGDLTLSRHRCQNFNDENPQP